MKLKNTILGTGAVCILCTFSTDLLRAKTVRRIAVRKFYSAPNDTSKNDTSKLKYPIKAKKPGEKGFSNSLDLKSPVKEEIRYNPAKGRYEVYRKIGNSWIATGESKTFNEYVAQREKGENKDYFKEKSKVSYQGGQNNPNSTPSIIPVKESLNKLFGDGVFDIQPSGSAEILLGYNSNVVRNPQLSRRAQRNGNIEFSPKLQLNVRGKIGEKVNIGLNFDTEATFDFENQTKLAWQGKEDDILKEIELGNVSLPLNSNLIQAGQSLFGVKTKFQLGKLTSTLIFTQQKGQTTETELTGGAQVNEFKISADNYDVNRHFFLGQYFVNNYDKSLSNVPLVMSSVIINRMEVWITNRSGNVDNNRDVVAFMDLAENNPYNASVNNGTISPLLSNEANNIYNAISTDPDARHTSKVGARLNALLPNLQQGFDYEMLNNARQLTENDYTVNKRLGYLSLNSALNADEVLAVAFEYTYNGKIYKVGEFGFEQNPSQAGEQNVLFLKLLKGPTIRTRIPMWELMMKNIYSLPTYNLSTEDFRFNIVYADDPSGADLFYLPVDNIPAFQSKNPLLRVFNLDRTNRQKEAKPDGIFDIQEGITIESQFARIIFPVRQPFGDFLRAKFDGNTDLANYYVYDALYDSTKWLASQDAQHNKFFLVGSYKGSSSNEIQLGVYSLKQGSVKVFSNGTALTEGADFIVDYSLGRVTITNQGILSSGAVIKVVTENQSLFNVQQKTLVGGRFDYKLNRNTLLGGTIMHLYERPLTPKTNIGDEPLLNTIFGVDGSYTNTSRFLTKMVDRLPFLETKQESSVTLQGEYARIIPHEAPSLQKGVRGVSYLDDFENSETQYDIRNSTNWFMASVPQKQPDLFPETQALDRTKWNNYFAKSAFYTIDPTFFRTNDSKIPDHIKNDAEMMSNHYMREVDIREVFPLKQLQQGVPNILPTFDLALYPKFKGQYNFNASATDLNADGTFKDPTKTWTGMMRRMETTDFEASNIDYIELWMMDPFIYEDSTLPNRNDGKFYIQLGNISEDVLPDRRKSFENGLPKDGSKTSSGLDTSELGVVPTVPTILNAFDNDPASRPNQDLGLDGMNNSEEASFWDTSYLKQLRDNFGTSAAIYTNALNDPANDNFVHYFDPSFDASQSSIIERYTRQNMMEDNSSISKKLSDGSPMSSSYVPNDEDINRDFTMNQSEDYFQYQINLSRKELVIGKNFVTDRVKTKVKLRNGKTEEISWYQFKIPIRQYNKVVGNVSDFKSIRFMRMVMKGFKDPIICRLGQIQLVRLDWRRYTNALNKPGVIVPVDPNDNTLFSVTTVNIEKNSKRKPIIYGTPPGIKRENDQTQPQAVQMNEQSLSMQLCNLKPNDSRAVFKTSNIDIRNYKTIKMFVHAEAAGEQELSDGDLRAFIRLGTDLTNNYYEYEIPLVVTKPGATAPSDIWPSVNEMNFNLEELYNVKLERPPGTPTTSPYFVVVNGRKISVIGLPDLSNVRAMMLGVKNVSDQYRCTEVWWNELRMQDITNKGGWAAIASTRAQLADFGSVNLSGNIKTIGFGGIDKKLNERSLTNNYAYDIASNFELGKFFPAKSGVTVPFFVGWNESFITPKFNPLNPDILYKKALDKYEFTNPTEYNRVKAAGLDYTSRYSINFLNVKKNKTGGGKSHLWDISNFNTTYAYSKITHTNAQIAESFTQTWKGQLAYNFSGASKPIKPFASFIKSQKLALVRDFNFNLVPTNINVVYNIDRMYSEFLARNNDKFVSQEPPRLFDKNFTMNRSYTANLPLTSSININYNAITDARIQEPYGRLDTREKREEVKREFSSLGRMTNFNQQIQASYQLPFSKIGFLNWINSTSNYQANYQWMQAPPAFAQLGNTIQNSRVFSINNQLNFLSFYNKFSKKKKSAPVSTRKPKSEDDDDSKSEAKKPAKKSGNGFVNFLKMIKNVTLNYSNSEGTVLPGFNKNIDYFGQNFTHDVPGLPFILGKQNSELRYLMAEKGALSQDTSIYNPYTQQYARTINASGVIEPITGFRIQLDLDKQWGNNQSSVFKYNGSEYQDYGFNQSGNYSMSYVFLKTAFKKDYKENGTMLSPVFEDFKSARTVIAQRLQNEDGRILNRGQVDPASGMPLGYSKSQQDVLVSSFWAAYTGKNSGTTSLSPFPKMPLPSWNVNITSLNKIKAIQNVFSNISFRHSYKGRYMVGSYTTNLAYDESPVVAGTKDLVSKYQVSNVTISDQFAPLAAVDFTTTNNWTGGITWNKIRNVMLMPANFSLNEVRTEDISIRGGFRGSDIRLPFRIGGSRVRLKNDVQFDLNIGIITNKTINRRLDVSTDQPTAGTKMINIQPTFNYQINEKVNFNVFYSRRTSKPFTGNYFPTALTDFGVKLQYTLQ